MLVTYMKIQNYFEDQYYPSDAWQAQRPTKVAATFTTVLFKLDLAYDA